MATVKPVIALIAATAIVLSGTPTLGAASSNSVKPGARCNELNAVERVFKPNQNKGKEYTCKKIRGKLRFSKGVEVFQVESLLTVSQVWQGNSVTLSLLATDGTSCTDPYAQGAGECGGFYIGWEANFDDTARSVTYSADGTETTIAGLQRGDRGSFHLMYDLSTDDEVVPLVVKRFPFAYDY